MSGDQFLLGRGSLTPSTLSILAICMPVGTDLPASQALMSDLGMESWWANCSWVQPLAFLA